MKPTLVKGIFLLLILIPVVIVLALYVWFPRLKGEVTDDWRIWVQKYTSGDEFISELPLSPFKEPAIYSFYPLEFNSPAQRRVEYISCLPFDKLVQHYKLKFPTLSHWDESFTEKNGRRNISYSSRTKGTLPELRLFYIKELEATCSRIVYHWEMKEQ